MAKSTPSVRFASDAILDESREYETTAAIERLFDRYHVAVFNYVRRLLDDDELAQDVTQEVFLKVLGARETLPQVHDPRAWVFRIATNLALNARKRWRRFTWLPWNAADDARGPKQDMAERVHTRLLLEDALRQLRPEHRAVLLLYGHYGFRVREIACILNISESAVKMRLYRAREQLRLVLKEMGARL